MPQPKNRWHAPRRRMMTFSIRYHHDGAAYRPVHQPLPRRAAQVDLKIATISRAEGGRLDARVGPPLAVCSVQTRYYDSSHTQSNWANASSIFAG